MKIKKYQAQLQHEMYLIHQEKERYMTKKQHLNQEHDALTTTIHEACISARKENALLMLDVSIWHEFLQHKEQENLANQEKISSAAHQAMEERINAYTQEAASLDGALRQAKEGRSGAAGRLEKQYEAFFKHGVHEKDIPLLNNFENISFLQKVFLQGRYAFLGNLFSGYDTNVKVAEVVQAYANYNEAYALHKKTISDVHDIHERKSNVDTAFNSLIKNMYA